LIFFIVAPVVGGVTVVSDGVIVLWVGGVPVVKAGSPEVHFLLRSDLLLRLRWKVIDWWGVVIITVVVIIRPLLLRWCRGLLCLVFFSVIIGILALVVLGSHHLLGYEECYPWKAISGFESCLEGGE
jgi:hypothetical protein